MSTTLERSGNTPQPYENVGNAERSSSSVDPSQPKEERPSEPKTTQSQGKSQTNVHQNQEQQPKQEPQDRPSPMSGRLGSAPLAKKSTGTKGEGREQPQEEEKGAVKGEGEGQGKAPPEPEGGYPEQLHAGKLEGVGPEFGAANRTTVSDRIKGIKEQIKGKVTRNPDLQERGKERMTGELKKKEHKEGEKELAEDDSSSQSQEKAESKLKDDGDKDMDLGQAQEANTGTTDVPSSHPTEKGSEEQASSIKPEGSGEPSEQEKAAKSTASDAEITSQK